MREMLRFGILSKGFKFSWIDEGNYLGFCIAKGDDRLVGLIKNKISELPRDVVMEIILHEIAHALDFLKHNRWRYKYVKVNGRRKRRHLIHDKVWREIAKEIGAKNPKAEFDVD